MIWHADDPVLLASSVGAMQRSLDALSTWAFRVKATPHTSSAKTVCIVQSAEAVNPRLFLRLVGQPVAELYCVQNHKWLGLLWSASLDLAGALDDKLRIASGIFASVAGLLSVGAPLIIVLHIFEAKVDGL